MILFGQLVCAGCRRILSYPLGAISCRCRNCNTVNAAQHIHLPCGCCGQSILVPINTLQFLCPCCATITDIPQSLLPRVEEPVEIGGGGRGGGKEANTIYVTYPVRRNCRKSKSRKGAVHNHNHNNNSNSNKKDSNNNNNDSSDTSSSSSLLSLSLLSLHKTGVVEEGMGGEANVLAGRGGRREAREDIGGVMEEEMEEIRAKHHVEEEEIEKEKEEIEKEIEEEDNGRVMGTMMVVGTQIL